MSLHPLKSLITPRPKLYAAQRRALGNWCYICSRTYIPGEKKFEVEHVVPKELFAPFGVDEYPAVLWICKVCHEQKTHDEQFVISRMLCCVHSITERYQSHIDAECDAIIAGHRSNLYASLLDASTDQSIFSEGGIYLGEATASILPNDSAKLFLERIGKGLWVRQNLVQPNWSDYTIQSKLEYFAKVENHVIKFNEVPETAFNQPLFGEWKDVFSFYGNSDTQIGSIWFMLFYNSYLGTVAIAHKNRYRATVE